MGVCRVRPRGMLGGFDTNVIICVIKPKYLYVMNTSFYDDC